MNSFAPYAQICISAPDNGLSGPTVTDWLERMLSKVPLSWVTATDIDVAGDVRSELAITAKEVRVMRTSTLMASMRRADQVVWASIFFNQNEADAMMIAPDETYETSAEKAEMTVRVVDAGYLYVLGKQNVLRGVAEALPPGEIRVGPIGEMDFPE